MASPLSVFRPRMSPAIEADETIGLITSTRYPAFTRKSWRTNQWLLVASIPILDVSHGVTFASTASSLSASFRVFS